MSVITPTYNRAKLLPRAINSVKAQTFKDYEHIIVDDASTDSTKEVIAQLDDKHIKYLRLDYKKTEQDKGAAKARNVGIKYSKGKYVAFLDSDDEWHPVKLKKQVEQFENLDDSFGMIYAGFRLILEKNEGTKTQRSKTFLPKHKGLVYQQLLVGNITGTCTAMVRKKILDEVGGFDPNMPSCQDWDLWIRVCRNYKAAYLNEILANAYVHKEQISSSFESKFQGRKRLLKKYRSEISKSKKALVKHLNIIGVLAVLTNRNDYARKTFQESAKMRPFQKSALLHFILSLISPKIHRKLILTKVLPKISSIAQGHGLL